VRSFPTSLRFAAVVAGITDDDVMCALKNSTYFTVEKNMIYRSNNQQKLVFDLSSGLVKTPHGIGRYVSFDSVTGEVTVEMDSQYLLKIDGRECYLFNQKEEI